MRGCVHGVVLAILTAVAVTIVPDRADAQFTDSLGGHWNNPGSALLQTFDEQTRKDHEDPYDVGRAAAYFVMTNYAVVAGREPSDQQADGAQKKFRASRRCSAFLRRKYA
jgi:hypothetical protein